LEKYGYSVLFPTSTHDSTDGFADTTDEGISDSRDR
jgi:hypothetical protein